MSEIDTLPPVAKSLLYPCKKCGEERYHRVLAHTTASSAKIECEICKSKKTFKLVTAKKKSASLKTGVAAKKRASKSLAPTQWQELNNRRPTESSATKYAIKSSFQENQIIDHKQFGIGFVTKVTGQKIEVVFQDQVRQLIHGR